MKRFFASALCLVAAPAVAAPEWAGYWAGPHADCSKTALTGESEQAPIYLADTEFRGLENTCDIWGAEDGPLPKTWVLSMSCSAEGTTYDEVFMVMLDGDDTLHSWSAWEDQGFLVSYQRCE